MRVQLLKQGLFSESGTLQRVLGTENTMKIDGRLNLVNSIEVAKQYANRARIKPDAIALYKLNGDLVYSELLNKELDNKIISTTPTKW